MRHVPVPLVLLLGLLVGCTSVSGPPTLTTEHNVNDGGPRTVLPGGVVTAAPALGSYARRISGHVYSGKAAAGYRLASVSQAPVANVDVQLRAFGQADATLAGATSDKGGAYALGTNDTTQPLFVMATVPTATGPELLFAPVPHTSAADVTVDIDLESTMLTQAYFDRSDKQPDWNQLLDPKTITTLRGRLDQLVTDQTAPDAHAPTALYQAMDQLAQQDATLKSTFAQLDALDSPAPSPSPLPSPHTLTPDSPLPAPTTGDPPIFDGSGSGVTASPRPGAYLSAAQTGLKQAGAMAAIRFADLDAVFLTAVDTSDNSLFVMFRDDGPAAHVAASQLGLTALASVALDKQEHLYALGGGKLARVTMAYGPQASGASVLCQDPAIAQSSALAVSPDGTTAYVGGADGKLVQLALPAGTVSATTPLAAGIVALACDSNGVDAVLADGSVVHATGNQASPLGQVPSAQAIGVDGSGRVFVGAKNELLEVARGQASDYLKTANAVAGVAGLGGYVFLTEASGDLDVVTTAE